VMRLGRGCILGALLLVAGCKTVSYDYTKEPDPRKHEFVIGASDLLRINVWKNAELTGEARVRPDGTITMPLIGDVNAAGRTPTTLQKEITRRLASYIKDESSIVSVAVAEVNSYRFTVSGNVEHAGVLASKYYVTVSEAIAMAGGLNKFANPHRLVVIRNDAGGFRRIPVDYERVASGQHPDEDIVMLTGDTLFVP
jgi:polysaccharide export outer membrane protein